ncbi:DUF5427 domain-containing protein MTC1 NDAI_0G06100 [Naumovozyma dairenensis CBS 421]|uniref:Maintenance of telomere capping protein 1 n=1 Tax=Naumovozyma dairenensis (strain ATCC 10597 / BCRC 20456 / CBS 421 / NBRC 0211 / NRRL Y-12639) TaxID=1071378 RepID=J7SB68_NAUDC|nr:hypothetical protein NDAI_0G06100 [Naumovozyma dairenensis CBS 421]CCK73593.1 hypothetical protein NDAI_0G06100 [Naumovozyma dairenensis CBS 421]
MTTERKSTEVDDVFEFLESLPSENATDKSIDDTNDNKGKTNEGGAGDEDIMDFLDELEKSNLSIEKPSKKKKGLTGNSADKTGQQSAKEEGKEKTEKVSPTITKEKEEEVISGKEEEENQEQGHEEEEEEEVEQGRDGTPLNDPITSISNWWSSSGQATVSTLWDKTTKQATSQIKKIGDKIGQDQLLQQSRGAIKITELAKNLSKIVVGETDEILRIHLVHDLINYSYLQYQIEDKFHQVLSSQVQGGVRIFVDEWGNPNKKDTGRRSTITDFNEAKFLKQKLNLFRGKTTDGEKLALANLENSIKLFNKAHDELLKRKKELNEKDDENSENDDDDEEEEEEQNKISDIFIAILPIAVEEKGKTSSDDKDIITTDASYPGNFNFTIVLKDITNNITTITRSQGFPLKWVKWLETEKDKGEEEAKEEAADEEAKEEELGVDPGDWVKDWIEDGLNLSFGIVAQNYVIQRMGF